MHFLVLMHMRMHSGTSGAFACVTGYASLLPCQAYPVLARNEAPVSGGVRWSRCLFKHCKHTYAKLKAQEPAALQLPAGVQA